MARQFNENMSKEKSAVSLPDKEKPYDQSKLTFKTPSMV